MPGVKADRNSAARPVRSSKSLKCGSQRPRSQPARPGRLWTHNDSGQPILFALDTRGAVTARVRVTGAAVDDWEAIAVGPCPEGSCVFVADIGDNAARRSSVTIYRIPEPAASEASAAVSAAFTLSYPDGAHDAEALLVTRTASF